MGAPDTRGRGPRPAALARALSVLRHHPGVGVAVLGAALLVAFAASSGMFVGAATRSEALKIELRKLTPLATGLLLRRHGLYTPADTPATALQQAEARDRAVDALRAGLGLAGRPVVTTVTDPIEAGTASLSEYGTGIDLRLMARNDALAHIRVLRSTSGPGVLVADYLARQLHLEPGMRLRLSTVPGVRAPGPFRSTSVRIKGIYRALTYETRGTPFWINWDQEIYQQNEDSPPPSSFAFTDRKELYRVAGALGTVAIDDAYELPADPRGITWVGGHALNRRIDAARATLADPASGLWRSFGCARPAASTLPPGAPICISSSSLGVAIGIADRSVSAVTPIIALLGAIGAVVALGAAASTGLFLVRRRRIEAALRFARGESAALFAGRMALEVLLPTLAGAALGYGLAAGLTGLLAPAGTLDGGTIQGGAARAAIGAGAGLVLLLAAAAAAYRAQFDTGSRRVPGLRWALWELPVLAVGLYLLVDVAGGGGFAEDASGGRQPTLAVFLLPLLLVAGASGLAVRLARLLLQRRRRLETRRVALFLAVRRLAATSGLLVALVVLSAVSFGAFFYAATLSGSLSATMVEKAYIAVGSDAGASGLMGEATVPDRFPYPLTKVQWVSQGAAIDSPIGPQVQALVIDPATFRQAIRWNGDWGPDPAATLPGLDNTASGALAVIVSPDLARARALWAQGHRYALRVVGVARTFPGMSAGQPFIVASQQALGVIARDLGGSEVLGVPITSVWAKGPPAAVARALAESPLRQSFVSTVDDFRNDPAVSLVIRTLGFIRWISVGTGLLALLGLLLHLQARQRAQIVSTALSQRMGLARRTDITALALELGAILLLAAATGGLVAVLAARPIIARLDPLPAYPPAAVFALPAAGILAALGALAAVAVAAAFLTVRSARQADVSEAFRA